MMTSLSFFVGAPQPWHIAGVISNEVRRDYNEANDHRPTLGSFKSLLKLLTPDSSTGTVSKATHLCRCNFLPYWGFVWDGWVLNFAFMLSPLLSTWKFYVPKYIAFCWDTEISPFQGVSLLISQYVNIFNQHHIKAVVSLIYLCVLCTYLHIDTLQTSTKWVLTLPTSPQATFNDNLKVLLIKLDWVCLLTTRIFWKIIWPTFVNPHQLLPSDISEKM